MVPALTDKEDEQAMNRQAKVPGVNYARTLELYRQGLRQTVIARRLDISPQRVSQLLRYAAARGELPSVRPVSP